MSMYESDQEKAPRTHKGDVAEAIMLLGEAIGALDEVIDVFRKRLDPILLDLPDGPMKSVAKEPQSRSPLADELNHHINRIRAQQARVEHFTEMIQI